MATFVKGNIVQVTPTIDCTWDQWSADHSQLCDKICDVVDVKYESWTNQTFVEVSYRGKQLWFLDRHLIIVDDYEEIYYESIHKACEELQRQERICKNLRDEILSDVFTPEEYRVEDKESKSQQESDIDNIFDDWEEVTTKEVIPLPVNGGIMTSPSDPKATADENRKKIRRIKSLGKKIVKKDKSKMSGSLSSSWTLTEEELQELQDYIDSLPDLATTTTDSRDIDYGWDDQWDGEWDNDGNAD